MDSENGKAAENAAVDEGAIEAAKASVAEEKAAASGVMKMIQRARSLIHGKRLVIVKNDNGRYDCEIKKFGVRKSFKKAALAALFDKVEEGEISVNKRSEVQYDLIVDGKVAYSAVEVV